MQRSRVFQWLLLKIASLLLAFHAHALNASGIVNIPPKSGPESELHLARMVFTHGLHSNWGPGRPWWRIDWPAAEHFFIGGLERYTAIDVAGDSVHMSLNHEALFDYPWLFAQQVGRWQLTDDEVLRLREYLYRGGFLAVDDFHGPVQWQIFEQTLQRVLPDHQWVELGERDELMHVLYTLDQRTQIPGRRHVRGTAAGGVAVQMPFSPPRWRGIHDADGRLMVAINFNMDMGDAWEHADDPVYPVAMTSLAYRFGINYIVYAMTH
ncbi:MAG: DUF4159 domain-containing protein [Granulosicoccus sp.]